MDGKYFQPLLETPLLFLILLITFRLEHTLINVLTSKFRNFDRKNVVQYFVQKLFSIYMEVVSQPSLL